MWVRNLNDELEAENDKEAENRAEQGNQEKTVVDVNKGVGTHRNPNRIKVRPSSSSFSSEILDEPLEKVKQLPMCKYDGRTDPNDHIAVYKSYMSLYTDTMSVWCKVFPITLTDLTSDWFKALGKGTIKSYDALKTSFTGQFVGQSKR